MRSRARCTFEKNGHQLDSNFIIGARHVLSGAVHSTELIKLFREIERNGEGAPESAFAAVLGIPDEVIERPLEASA